VWLSVDPLAEKYPNVSSYVYCKDNPVIAVDPDGKELIFVVRHSNSTTQYTYHNGNFYDSNHNRYDPGKSHVSLTMYKVLSAYRKTEASGDKKLINKLHTLETSKYKHYMEQDLNLNPENAVHSTMPGDAKKGISTGTQTTFDFSDNSKKEFEESEKVPNSDFTTVMHEMQHQYDNDQGNMKDNTGSDANNPAEIRAVNTENRARKIEKLQKRTTYGTPIDPKKLDNPPNKN
jgi:hypothetical protein